jgi:septum site-determining protein MinC
MPGDNQSDNSSAGYGRNGRVDRPFQSRIADLLDNVTVGDAATADASVAPDPFKAGTAAAAGMAAHDAPQAPPLPGVESGPLPPFLAQNEPPAAGRPASLPAAAIPATTPIDALTGHDGPPAAEKNDATLASAVIAAMAAGAVQGTGDTPVEAASGEAVPPTAPGPAISIRGRADGLAIEIGKGSWHEIMAALEVRLDQSASFFRSARVALDVGARPVTEAELTELIGVLTANGMSLGAVRTSAERTFQSALTLGLTATLESAEGLPVADAAPAATNATTSNYFVYRGYLRSGHKLQRQEHILIIGDINPGAEVVSQGDVLVWGRLRGVVHAGAGGNQRSIVAALDLEPTQLRIADVMTIGPDPRPGQPGKWFWQRSATKRPEVARIANGAIVLEEWDASRPGGLVSLRRRG